jgi:positive regulator of sigma E activity
MASIGEFGASSFDSYEGIRIVIPGVIVFTAGYSTYLVIAPGNSDSLSGDTLLSVVASLVVGLILYFWDLPARSAAFAELQPTNYLEKEFPAFKPGVLLTAYLLILNTKMPANIRNRSLYMGSMYRIGLEMILALSFSSYVVFGASLFDYGAPVGDSGTAGRIFASLALLITFFMGLLISRGYERKSAFRMRLPETGKLREALKNFLHKSMLVYGLGIVAVVVPNLTVLAERLSFAQQRGICAAGLAVCAGYWAQRYVRGDQLDANNPRKRQRMESPASGFLFAAPLALVLGTYKPGSSTILSTGSSLTAWTAVACLSLMSIMIRGHERKLHGGYMGQTRWLKDNPDEFKDILPGRKAP